MKILLDILETGDYKEIESSILTTEIKSLPLHQLLEIEKELPLLVERFPSQIKVYHDITWYKYELIIWSIGDLYRRILSKNKKYRDDQELFRMIVRICMNKLYKKGRQSWVILLGKYGGPLISQVLISFLNDADINGHALYGLRLLRSKDASEFVKPFLDHKNTWIRNEAKKYYKSINI